MAMMITRLCAIALLLLLAACGLPGNVVVLMPEDNGAVGKVSVSGGGSSVELDRPLQAVETRPGAAPGAPFVATREDVSAAFAGALGAMPRTPQSFVIYFLNALADPDPASRGELDAAIAAAKALPNVDISVTGHADATGAESENLALSLRRAERVRDALVAAGVPVAVIEVTYHGSNNPRVPSPPGVPEPRNRRVEITIR
jgi:outer membrane protein OmpA-like peptidoglycan-associated protein